MRYINSLLTLTLTFTVCSGHLPTIREELEPGPTARRTQRGLSNLLQSVYSEVVYLISSNTRTVCCINTIQMSYH